MSPKEIIAEAWHMTMHVKAIRRWGFASAILETLFDVKLLTYQLYFAYSYFILKNPIEFFAIEELLHKYMPMWGFLTFIITLIILFTIEFFLPKMCLGAVIGLAAKSHKKEPVRGGLVLALYNFFPIFAIHELFVLAKLTTVITIASLILRYMVEGLQMPLLFFLFFLLLLSNLLKFFTSFAEEEVVIQKTGFLSALGRSFKLIISHLRHVLFLLLLMVVISVRVLINALVLFLLPAVIIGISVVIAYFFSTTVTILLSTVIGIAIIVVAAYFFAYLHVFQQTVWTITYMELSKLKDLDIIGIETEEEKKEKEITKEQKNTEGTLTPQP